MDMINSHPGKPLWKHSINVMNLGMTEFKSKRLQRSSFNLFGDQEFDLELFVRVILLTHDFGKGNKFFQARLMHGDNSDKRGNHGQLSGVFTYYILDKLFEDPLVAVIGYCIVARHHGNLKDFRDVITFNSSDIDILIEQFNHTNLEVLQNILEKVDINLKIVGLDSETVLGGLSPKQLNKVWRREIRDRLVKLELYFLVNLVYSLLISADKAEAIFYSNKLSYADLEKLVLTRTRISGDLVDNYKKLKGWDQPNDPMNQKRNQIYDEVIGNIKNMELSNRILSINVPTGTGKTLTALSAALHLRERLAKKHGVDYRIIYTLPFTSIIDQNYEVFDKVLTTVGIQPDQKVLLKHHYLTPKKYVWNEMYDDQSPDISEHLVETWNSEIIVTTFVQLLHTIFANQNRSLKKFHQLSNSIILLDEVQSIPHRYWMLVRETLKMMSDLFNCYFVFITATMPLIFNEKNGEILELARSKKDYFAFFDRIKLDSRYLQKPMNLDQFKQILNHDISHHANKSFLIVLNTIGTSLEIYTYLHDEMKLGNLVYLSTNIIPLHRLERIERIKDADQPLVVVSTQMVEAGVDIDIDRVYRDFGPLDSVNQTCGRCNRNFDSSYKGEVIIVNLVNQNHANRGYADYIYGNILLSKTRDVFNQLPSCIAEKNFFEMNQQYFTLVSQAKSNDQSEVLLQRMMELKYKLAFEDDSDLSPAQTSQVFRLIDKDQETVNLFIEIDERAIAVWEEYELLKQIDDPFKRKIAMEAIKGDLLSYVITIPKRVAKKQLEDNQLESFFNYISITQLNQLYDTETGFIREITETTLSF